MAQQLKFEILLNAPAYFMKKLLLFILIAVAGIITADAQTVLRARLADNSQINVAVNGRYFDKRGTTITVGDLPPGRHSLKIYTLRYDRWGRNYQHLIYQGAVRTSTGMVTNFTYDPYSRRINTQQQYLDDNAPQNPIRDENNDGREDVVQSPMVHDKTRLTSPDASPVASPITTDAIGSLTDKESEALKIKVDAKNTDTEKLKLLKDELRKESLSTLQVSYIMDWLLFESTKVEFAKWAYSLTVDKENYSSLSPKLTYKSSQEELNDYVNDRK